MADKNTAAIFDLDGTLVDSAPDLVAALNHTLARRGLPGVEVSVARRFIGHGARAMIRAGRAAHGAPAPNEREAAADLEAFLAHYRAHIADASRPFPGVVALLQGLRAAGAPMAVCTNKREALAVSLLEALGLSTYFVTVVGRDTLGVAKPDPAPAALCKERTGAPAAVFFGDSDADIGAAVGADMPCLIHEKGYGPLERAGEAFATFQSYVDASALFDAASSPSSHATRTGSTQRGSGSA
ncbi:MAG: HAD-IA family hydrolase [Pseudomonadota bacterium]